MAKRKKTAETYHLWCPLDSDEIGEPDAEWGYQTLNSARDAAVEHIQCYHGEDLIGEVEIFLHKRVGRVMLHVDYKKA